MDPTSTFLFEAKLARYQYNDCAVVARRSHRSGQCVLGGGIDQVESRIVIGVFENVDLNSCERSSKWLYAIAPTVRTGPKISSTMVTDLGSFVRITVGWTK